jgi:hypothetical protein
MELLARVFDAGKKVCGSNCPVTVFFRNPTASNLMLIEDAARAKIVYSPQIFTAVYDRYGDPGILALLAHANGHALDDAIGAAWIEKSWTAEVRADAWAGCTLAKSTLSRADLQMALSALAEYPSPAHPQWSVRRQAIRTGYSQCGGTASSFDAGK